jgi:hypothetical protein
MKINSSGAIYIADRQKMCLETTMNRFPLQVCTYQQS